jgi:hypothetical protein
VADRPPIFGGEAGEPVPSVDPEDLRAAFEAFRDAAKNHPDAKTLGAAANGAAGIMPSVKAGADVKPLYFRSSFLQFFISRVPQSELSPWVTDGLPDDVMFREMARIPMQWMAVGISQQGLPFDPDELMRRVSIADAGTFLAPVRSGRVTLA